MCTECGGDRVHVISSHHHVILGACELFSSATHKTQLVGCSLPLGRPNRELSPLLDSIFSCLFPHSFPGSENHCSTFPLAFLSFTCDREYELLPGSHLSLDVISSRFTYIATNDKASLSEICLPLPLGC